MSSNPKKKGSSSTTKGSEMAPEKSAPQKQGSTDSTSSDRTREEKRAKAKAKERERPDKADTKSEKRDDQPPICSRSREQEKEHPKPDRKPSKDQPKINQPPGRPARASSSRAQSFDQPSTLEAALSQISRKKDQTQSKPPGRSARDKVIALSLPRDDYRQAPLQVFSAPASSGSGEPPLSGGNGRPWDNGSGGKKGGDKDKGKKRDKGKGRAIDAPGGAGDGGPGGDEGGVGSGGSSDPKGLRNQDQDVKKVILANFPPEVRDEVFSRLLDHRVVAYDPHNPPAEAGPSGSLPARPHPKSYFENHGRAQAYNFHFDLLHKTNRATRKEAIAYVQERNKFILIEYDMPYFTQYLHEADIAVVSHWIPRQGQEGRKGRENLHGIFTAMSCVAHAVLLRVTWDMHDFMHDEDDTSNWRITHADTGQFLILSTEFPKLCLLFKHLCEYVHPPGVYIMSGREEKEASTKAVYLPKGPNGEEPPKHTPTFELVFTRPELLIQGVPGPRDEPFINHAEWMLKHFRTITGGGHGLSISYTEPKDPPKDPNTLEKLESLYNALKPEALAPIYKAMAPGMIWLHSLRAAQYETSVTLRARIHANVANLRQPSREFDDFAIRHFNLYEHAVEQRGEMYSRLIGPAATGWAPLQHNPDYKAWHTIAFPYQWANTAEAMALLLITSTLLYHYPIGRVRGIMGMLAGYEGGAVGVTRRMKLQLCHLQLLVAMEEERTSRLRDVVDDLKPRLDNMKEIHIFDYYSQAKHDMDIMKAAEIRLADDQSYDPNVSQLLNQMSLFTTGFFHFGPIIAPEHPVQSLDHWQDEDATARLSYGSKMSIRKMQWERGFRVSDFGIDLERDFLKWLKQEGVECKLLI